MAIARKELVVPLLLLLATFLDLSHGLNAGDEKQPQKTGSKKRDGAVQEPPAQVEEPKKSGDKKRDGAVQEPPQVVEPPQKSEDGNVTDCSKCPQTTVAPSAEKPAETNNGFGAGSIFVSILFGMGLMFGLSQLYVIWEKRRLGDSPSYRGY